MESMVMSAACGPGVATTSGRPPLPSRPPAATLVYERKKRGHMLQLRRVTNEGKEMSDEELEKFNEEYINLGPQWQVPEPEKGPLEQRVQATFVDGLLSGEINLEDSEYWFTQPDGGWNQVDKVVKKAKVVPTTYASAVHRGSNRRPLRDFQEGMELEGVVEAVYFFLGIKVDFGGQIDGLIPTYSTAESWAALAGQFQLDTPVRVRVHRVFQGPRCRFPIQLELLEPAELAPLMMRPEEYAPSYDFRGLSTVEELQWAVGPDYGDVTDGKDVELNIFSRQRLEEVEEDVSSVRAVEDWEQHLTKGIGPILPMYLPPSAEDDLALSWQ